MIEKRNVRTEEFKASESAKMLKEYKIDYIPENWSYVGILENTPEGYKWINNNKCWLSDEYKRALISDELFENNKVYLTAQGIYTKNLQPGDITFIKNNENNYVKTKVLGIGADIVLNNVSVKDIPYVDYYDGYEYNIKNYILNEKCKLYIKNYRIIRILNDEEEYLCTRDTLEESIKDLTHIFTRDWIKNPAIKDPANYIIFEKENGEENGVFYRIDISGNIIEKGTR